MRVLFVSGTASGGAALSTHELADQMVARGHTVGMIVRRRQVNTGLASPTGRWVSRKGPARVIRGMERTLRRRPPHPVASSHGPVWSVRHLERLAPPLIEGFAPDVVVVNTVHSRAWATLRRSVAGARPLVLYVREHGAVEHAMDGGADLVVANARSHADAVVRRGGQAVVVPSVVDTAASEVASTRTTVLCVNPIPSRGLDIALEVARLRPEWAFAFQESHQLTARNHRVLRRRLRGSGNVELRRLTGREAVYRDASVLMVPYLNDNRPRVVLEAQANGIPVVATDRPGLAECVGPGGVMVAGESTPEAWVEALDGVLDDPGRYAELCAAARAHAARAEVAPDALAEQFEAALLSILTPSRH